MNRLTAEARLGLEEFVDNASRMQEREWREVTEWYEQTIDQESSTSWVELFAKGDDELFRKHIATDDSLVKLVRSFALCCFNEGAIRNATRILNTSGLDVTESSEVDRIAIFAKAVRRENDLAWERALEWYDRSVSPSDADHWTDLLGRLDHDACLKLLSELDVDSQRGLERVRGLAHIAFNELAYRKAKQSLDRVDECIADDSE